MPYESEKVLVQVKELSGWLHVLSNGGRIEFEQFFRATCRIVDRRGVAIGLALNGVHALLVKVERFV